MNLIRIYTLEGCPKCEILKKKLAQHNILFDECRDKEKMASLGIGSCPVLDVGGRLMNFAEAVSWVNEEETDGHQT